MTRLKQGWKMLKVSLLHILFSYIYTLHPSFDMGPHITITQSFCTSNSMIHTAEGSGIQNNELKWYTCVWPTCMLASLLQQLVDRMCSHWLSPKLVDKLLQACSRLATSSMNSTALSIQVVPTTCYRAASQQLVNKLWVTNLAQLDKITALLQTCWQACYKLVASTTCWQDVRNSMCTKFPELHTQKRTTCNKPAADL